MVRGYIRSNILGFVAIFIALGGVGIAAGLQKNSVKSKQIKDGQVKNKDLAADAVDSSKVIDSSLIGADIQDGSLTGADVGADSLTGADINESSLQGIGARAFGRVASDGTLSASKNASVSHPSNGVFCVTAAASVTEPRVLIAAIDDTDGGAATVPGNGNIGFAIGHVTNVFPAAPCPVGTHQVSTFVYNGDEVDDDDGGGNSAGGLVALDDEPFTFVIP